METTLYARKDRGDMGHAVTETPGSHAIHAVRKRQDAAVRDRSSRTRASWLHPSHKNSFATAMTELLEVLAELGSERLPPKPLDDGLAHPLAAAVGGLHLRAWRPRARKRGQTRTP